MDRSYDDLARAEREAGLPPTLTGSGRDASGYYPEHTSSQLPVTLDTPEGRRRAEVISELLRLGYQPQAIRKMLGVVDAGGGVVEAMHELSRQNGKERAARGGGIDG